MKLVALLVILLTAGCAAPQTGAGSTPTPSPKLTAPLASGYAGMADASGDLGVLLFGGFGGPGGDWISSLWSYRPGGTWSELSYTSRAVPPPGDGFAFQVQTRRAIFLDGAGVTWVFDANLRRWEDRKASNGPSRHGIHAIYDKRSDRLIVFGGDNFRTKFDSTWIYDYTSNVWTEKAPKMHPPARIFYAAAYDEKSERVILFGGNADAGLLDDTWAYDYRTDTWTQMTPRVSPPAREYSSMVYDAVGGRILMFGGAAIGEVPLQDTWAYDSKQDLWTELKVSGPGARAWHAMAFDVETGSAVLFGGGPTRESYNNEVWVFDSVKNGWTKSSP